MRGSFWDVFMFSFFFEGLVLLMFVSGSGLGIACQSLNESDLSTLMMGS